MSLLDSQYRPILFRFLIKVKILSLGSCFAQTIGQKMIDASWLYGQPYLRDNFQIHLPGDFIGGSTLPMINLTENLICERDASFFFPLLFTFRYHRKPATRINHRSLLQKREENKRYFRTRETHLIKTLGTAWGNELRRIWTVANCHKQHSGLFSKRPANAGKKMESKLWNLFDNFFLASTNLKNNHTHNQPCRAYPKMELQENQLSKRPTAVLCPIWKDRFSSVSYFLHESWWWNYVIIDSISSDLISPKQPRPKS